MSEDVRADAILKNLPQGKLDELWLLRHPEDGGKRKTLAEIRKVLPKQFGVSAALSTLSGFYAWLRQQRRMKAACLRAEQAKRQLIEQNPDASAEELEQLGQMIFTSETVEDGDIKGFIALLKASNARRKLEIEERRVQLLEQKAKAADEASDQWKRLRERDAEMSDAEREEAMKLIDEKLLGLR